MKIFLPLVFVISCSMSIQTTWAVTSGVISGGPGIPVVWTGGGNACFLAPDVAINTSCTAGSKLTVGDFNTSSPVFGSLTPQATMITDRSTDITDASVFGVGVFEYPNFGSGSTSTTYTAFGANVYNNVSGSHAQDYRGATETAVLDNGGNANFIIGNQATGTLQGGATAGRIWATYGNATVTGTSSSATNETMGVRGLSQATSSGNINNAYGVYSLTQTSSSGTITTAYGLYSNIVNGGTSIGTGYGLYIDAIAGTTNYGIYQSLATNHNYLAGQTGIGAAANSTFGAIMLQLSSNNGAGVPSGVLVNGAGSNGTGIFLNASEGTITSPTHINNGDQFGEVAFLAYGDTSPLGSGSPSATIYAKAAADFTDSNKPTDFVFATTKTGSANPTDLLTLYHTLSVGINNDVPQAQLDIVANAANVVGLNVNGATSQTADLQDWQVNNSLKASIDKDGKFTTPAITLNGTVISNVPEFTIPFATGSLTSVVANEIVGSYKTVNAVKVKNIVAAATVFTCVANPVITMLDCGTSAGACTSGTTTIGSVTLTAANTQTDGSISSANVAAGHYIAWQVSSGTCTSITASGSASVQMQ